jgi:ubiquinol-cytochrome c reductase cytochrome b subunit
LQRKDSELLEHGLEIGIVKQLHSGEFAETRRPLDEEKRAVIGAEGVPVLMRPPGSQDKRGVPSPASRGALGRARAIVNRAFAQTVVFETNGHGNGHRAGAAGEHVAVGPAGDRRTEDGLVNPAQQAPSGNPGQWPPG